MCSDIQNQDLMLLTLLILLKNKQDIIELI